MTLDRYLTQGKLQKESWFCIEFWPQDKSCFCKVHRYKRHCFLNLWRFCCDWSTLVGTVRGRVLKCPCIDRKADRRLGRTPGKCDSERVRGVGYPNGWGRSYRKSFYENFALNKKYKMYGMCIEQWSNSTTLSFLISSSIYIFQRYKWSFWSIYLIFVAISMKEDTSPAVE